MDKRKPKKTIKPPKKITERYLTNSGLYYLQRFTASTGHFRFIMMRKVNKSCKHHIDQDLVECEKHLDTVIANFVELGHLNDPAYCTGMVTSMRRKGLSRRAITMKLRQKRLPPEMIEETLCLIDAENNPEDTDPDLRAAVLYAKKKRLGPFMRPDKIHSKDDEQIEKIKNRSLGSLARAGYSFGIAKDVLDMNEEEALEIINSARW